MDNQMIKSLIKVLEQETLVYEDMLRISTNKTGIIVEGKVTELENIVKLEQSLFLQMGKLEDQRETLIQKLASELGQKPEDISISTIINALGTERSEKLLNVQNRIGSILKEVKNSNDLNSKLIKSSLDFINFSLNLVVNNENSDNNYNLSGAKPTGKSKSLFDTKI